MLIPSGLIAFVSLLATLVMLAKKHYENAFTRACVTIFYLLLTLLPIPIDMARELNRWFWFLVLGVEVLWWGVTRLLKWWRKRNDHS